MSGSATPAHTSTPAVGPQWISYGSEGPQFGVLYLPSGFEPTVPVVVVIHGGGWEAGYTLDDMSVFAEDLVGHGVAVWNIEYRAVGNGGGWPETFIDVAAAVDSLAGPVQEHADNRLDLDRVHVLGYSAGGHLAVWSAGRALIAAGSPGANPVVTVRAAVGIAPVLDLAALTQDAEEADNVLNLMGGSISDYPDRYAVGSPISQLPLGVPVTCVHGDTDQTVPVAQSISYVAAAVAAGDRATLHVLPGLDHNSVMDIDGDGWKLASNAVMSEI